MRHVDEHAPGRSTQSEAPAAQPRAAPVDRLLEVQRTAGNRAVGALVARAPRPKAKPKDPQRLAERRISHVVLTGLAPIELLSWSWAGGGMGPGAGGASSPELQITTRTGAHSGAMIGAVAAGREFAQAELVVYGPQGGGFRVLLGRVMITSYQNSPGENAEGPLEHFGLSGQDVKVSMEPSAP